jgi:hypothetical protein
VQQKFAQANIEQLELWGDRILDAKILAEVFDQFCWLPIFASGIEF